MVPHLFDARLSGAIRAAVKRSLRFDAVADDLAAAVIADRRKFVNRTFEAVERVTRAGSDHFKRKVIVVAADFTLRHF